MKGGVFFFGEALFFPRFISFFFGRFGVIELVDDLLELGTPKGYI
jgi:hypothetical protein